MIRRAAHLGIVHPAARRRAGGARLWAIGSLALVAVLSLILWSPWQGQRIAANKELVLYCAAGILRPVEAAAEEYRQEYGVSIRIEPAGSGQLLSKIRSAPRRGDLYLAGDSSYIDLARREGLVAEAIPLALLRPVLVVNRATQERLTEQGRPIQGLDDLLREDLHIVLANPELASVGRVTQEALTASGDWETLQDRMRSSGAARVSTVGTVTEVAQAVRLRDGHLGVVWDAEAAQHKELVAIHVDRFDEVPEHVTIGVLTGAQGDRATAALQFARYLSARDRGLRQFDRFGFQPIEDADRWSESPELVLMSGAMLKPGIEQVLKDFERREGVTIKTTYNGCGILVAQIEGMRRSDQGVFPDAYFSCDQHYMEMVQGYFEAATTVARNDMVIAVQKGNPLRIESLEDLGRQEVRVGLAHPVNSALGKLTEDLIHQIGLAETVYAPDWQSHIVHSDAGHDLVNKLRVKSLDAAVVYRSNVQAIPTNFRDHLDVVEIDVPGALAEQPFAIAKDSQHKYLMQRLLRAIVSAPSAEHFQKIGFSWAYEGGDE